SSARADQKPQRSAFSRQLSVPQNFTRSCRGRCSPPPAHAALLLPSTFFRDPCGGLPHVVALCFFLQFRRFLHQLARTVCERFGPFAFLAGLLPCGLFALCHEPSLSHTGRLGYPLQTRPSAFLPALPAPPSQRHLTSHLPKTRLKGERARPSALSGFLN